MKQINSTIHLVIFLSTGFLIFGCGKNSSTEVPPATTPIPTPTVTPAGFVSKMIAVGTSHSFAINSSHIAKAFGSNYESINDTYGQLGIGLGTNTNRTIPQTLNDSGTTFLSIVAGEIQSCALTSDKVVKCWGANVGDGSGGAKFSPTLINDGGATTYLDIASGSYHSCAITSFGEMKCWGDGWEGKLGNGDGTGATQDSPVTAFPGTTFKKVAAGRNHTCGITSADAVKCWGTNSAGQVGDGSTSGPRLIATTVDSGVAYKEISAGEDSTCGITTSGILKCWGDNGNGQLGDNSTTTQPTPIIIDSGTNYSKISLSATFSLHTCGITTTGVLKCWGDNSSGQIGNGGTTPSLTPVVIDSGTSYREVAVTYMSSCAITTSGSLKCWGNNSVGQLGIGNTTQMNSPTLVGTGY